MIIIETLNEIAYSFLFGDFINTTYDISLDSMSSDRCSKRILSDEQLSVMESHPKK